jgi:hypothetical protein
MKTPRKRANALPILAILLLTLGFGLVVTLGVLSTVSPPRAPSNVVAGSPLGPRLSQRVLFVIVDGLRYDVATNPEPMPRFAAAMQSRTSGEVWAGRVSMTSSAVLSIGTGQRGRLEQVVRNIKAEPPPHNSWIANARAAGLRVGVVGDGAWQGMYGPDLWEFRGDPEGVAIDVDFNPQAFQNTRDLLSARPDVLIAHFVTPDHQGHAYGIRSERYRKHIHDFDGLLFELLAGVDPSYTVIVTSDHGAADSGTHGTDAPIQRRTPMFAYGPGIRTGVHDAARIEQVDLSVLLPVLIGVAPPAHGVGALLTRWLDLSPTDTERMSCELAQRTLVYGDAALGAGHLDDARAEYLSCSSGAAVRSYGAEQAIRITDTALLARTGLSFRTAAQWLSAITIFGSLLAILVVGRIAPVEMALGLAIIGVTAWLVQVVEKLPGIYPNVVRGVLLTLGNILLLLSPRLTRKASLVLASPDGPAAAAESTSMRWNAVAVLLSLLLVGSYTATTRPQAFVTEAILAPVLCGLGFDIERATPFFRALREGFTALRAVALFFGMLLLFPTLLRENGNYTSLFPVEGMLRPAAAVVVAAWVVFVARQRRFSLLQHALVIAIAVGPVFLRSHVNPLIGRGAWIGMTVLGMWALARRRPVEAQIGLFSGFLWITRDLEVFAWVGALFVATVVGERLAATSRGVGKNLVAVALVTILGFALCFLVRVGMQDGVEFGGIDWGAGAFRDPFVSPWLIGTALVAKYALAAFLVGFCLSSSLDPAQRSIVCRGLSLCFIARTLALAAMFFVAGNSFWTALRVLGDLPSALAMGLGSIVLLIWTDLDAPAEALAPENSTAATDTRPLTSTDAA